MKYNIDPLLLTDHQIWQSRLCRADDWLFYVLRNKKCFGNRRKLYNFLKLTLLTDFSQNFYWIYLYIEIKRFIENLDWNFRLSTQM